MAKLDMNGYNATFRTFVEFAEKTRQDGYNSACARATFSGKKITVSALSLHETSYVLRKTGEKTVNDATRAIFKNAVAEMFGGEANIPERVKKAMLLGDYGNGSPLTARRIMAVKDAIDEEDSMREKGVSQFANPATREAALAKGYHPSELGRLANAVNYFMKATGASEEMALEVVSAPGTQANRLMNYGGRFLKSAEAFAEGLAMTDIPADMHDDPVPVADARIVALCGGVHARQIAKVMAVVSESGPAAIADNLAGHGINGGGQLPADFTLAKNDETGDVFIRFTGNKELPFRFEWSATVRLDGSVVVSPFQFTDGDALKAMTDDATAKIDQKLHAYMQIDGERGVGEEACAAAARKLVDFAKDDPGLLHLLLENNCSAVIPILADSAFGFRTDEEIEHRLNALRANVDELRMAVNGDARAVNLAVQTLADFEGQPLEEGKIAKVFAAVRGLDLSPVTEKTGSRSALVHFEAVNDIRTMILDVIRATEIYDGMDKGRDVEVGVNRLIFTAICGRLGEDTLRWLRDGLHSDDGLKTVGALHVIAVDYVQDHEAGHEVNADANAIAQMLMGFVDTVCDNVLDSVLGIGNPEPPQEFEGQLAEGDIRPVFDAIKGFAAKEKPEGFREAKESAAAAYGRFDKEVLDRMISKTLSDVAGDPDAAKLVARHMQQLLVRSDATLRSLDEVRERARAILANVKELREVAKGDEGMVKAGTDLLGMLEGRSLPPGWFVHVLAGVKNLSLDPLKNIRPGCGALRLHSAFRSFADSTQAVLDGADAGGLQGERIHRVSLRTFIGTLILARCGQRNMQSLSEALHGADGEHLQQVYGDFESGDHLYEPGGDNPGYTKMQMSVLAVEQIRQLNRFDSLVAQAAGQDMANYQLPDYDAENVVYSQDVVETIGREFEEIVRANPDAYGPQ